MLHDANKQQMATILATLCVLLAIQSTNIHLVFQRDEVKWSGGINITTLYPIIMMVKYINLNLNKNLIQQYDRHSM